jgi:hypothetical protein
VNGTLETVNGTLETLNDTLGTVGTIVDPLTTQLGSALEAGLLNVDAKVTLDADFAAPIAGAVALNANVAAPVDAAVSANVASVSSDTVAIADQTGLITQKLDGIIAHANVNQTADIKQ